jgi:two-component system, cell cycle response regulator
MKVLVAEDEPVSRRMIESLLLRWGYEVQVARDGFEAVQILQQADSPKLAVVDWLMPGVDGIQLCHKIRQLKAESYTYVLLLTGKHTQEDVITGLEAGADDYLTKPFDPPELRVRLRTGKRILHLMDQLVAARETLRSLATHDGLTGLWNHSAILEILDNELGRAERHSSTVGVILFDIDHFKYTNDTYGHRTGDHVLTEVGHVARTLTRPYDAVGRYGGEEFLVIVPGCDELTAVSHAERLRMAISRAVVKAENDQEVSITASFGVTVTQRDTTPTVEALVQAADTALYRAKDAGRNQVAFQATALCGPAMPQVRTGIPNDAEIVS